jgi:hypothetical protein
MRFMARIFGKAIEDAYVKVSLYAVFTRARNSRTGW